jgi:hypothetical protein
LTVVENWLAPEFPSIVTAYETGVGGGVVFDAELTPAQEEATIPRPSTAQIASARALRLPGAMPMKANPTIPKESIHTA